MTREDINNIISAICPNDEDFEKPIISPKYLMQELEQLTLEQEPEVGHWIEGKCDQCGGHAPFWSMSSAYYKSNYCPNCGRRMEDNNEKTD